MSIATPCHTESGLLAKHGRVEGWVAGRRGFTDSMAVETKGRPSCPRTPKDASRSRMEWAHGNATLPDGWARSACACADTGFADTRRGSKRELPRSIRRERRSGGALVDRGGSVHTFLPLARPATLFFWALITPPRPLLSGFAFASPSKSVNHPQPCLPWSIPAIFAISKPNPARRRYRNPCGHRGPPSAQHTTSSG